MTFSNCMSKQFFIHYCTQYSVLLIKFIDKQYNGSKLLNVSKQERTTKWLEWSDQKMSKATVPILYGTLGSAFKTTTRISKLENFGFISKRLYAWVKYARHYA